MICISINNDFKERHAEFINDVLNKFIEVFLGLFAPSEFVFAVI